MTVGDSSVDSFLEIAEDEASLLCDLRQHDLEIAFSYGDKIPIKKLRKSFGGSAYNTAIGFSRLGQTTYISTIIPEDALAGEAINRLKQNNIGVDYIKREGEFNQATIIVYRGERTIFSYHCERNYENLQLPRADWIYFASANKGSEKLANKAIEWSKQGSRIAFNPGSWQLKNFKLFEHLVSVSEIFILNKIEADLIVGEGKFKDQLDRMHELGAKVAVITDAANGAYVSSGNEKFHMGIVAVSVIDPTGAGDAFSSAFVCAVINCQNLEESAKWGMVNSAAVLERFGANEGLLDAKQLKTRLSENKTLKAVVI